MAEYVLTSINLVPTMTASQLAKNAESSPATVIRFSKKLGFESFTDFKVLISSELQSKVTNGYSEIDPTESFWTIKDKMKQNTQYTITETLEFLEEDNVLNILHAIDEAEVLYVYGAGASFLAAEDIMHKWSRLGKTVICHSDLNVLLPQMVSSSCKSLVWLVSHSGKSPEAVFFANEAKKLEIPTLSLTQFGLNPLAKVTDYVLQTSRSTESSYRKAATTSIMAQFLTIDVLFYFYLSKVKQDFAVINQTKDLIENYKKQFK